MKVAVLFSGGKDSCLATWYALHQGWDISALVSAKPANSESWMFHFPSTEWVGLQAEAMGFTIRVFKPSQGKEQELLDLREILNKLKQEGTEGVISGAIASDYQRKRLDAICDELQLPSFVPLWGKDPSLLLSEMLALGFETYITGVSAMGLDSSWLGRRLDDLGVSDLLRVSKKYHFHPAGEGGEYETFVTDALFFNKRIQIEKMEKRMRGTSGYLVISRASLVDKI